MLLGSGKKLKIAKQLFDTATISDYVADFDLISRTYDTAVAEVTAFRGENWSRKDVLYDTIKTFVNID